jgi:glycosyltransferase involved in cell wall biosynthesis
MNDTRATAILYFGNDWNAENRTSSHHIACRLAKHYQVYYVECPGLRAPRRSTRDFGKILTKLGRFFKGTRQVRPQLRVCTLLQIPLHRFSIVRRINARLIRWSVRWMMWRHRVRNPICWFVVPHIASLAGRLGESLSVYYCIDDYASLPDVDAESVRPMDETLTRKADIVFVASEMLLAAKAALNPNTYHSPHGVDVEHFGAANGADGEAPDDIKDLTHPVIGFHGLIERWIDLDLVAFLARQRPKWSYLMIGRVAVPAAELPQLSNLHFIGSRPYERLPEYGRHLDATIIPYRLNQQVLHANPLKLREYLAMGKPVVSVRTPETEKFRDVVELADGPEDFLAKLEKVVQEPMTKEAASRRMDRVAGCSWDARVAEVLNVVRAHLEARFEKCDLGATAKHTASASP